MLTFADERIGNGGATTGAVDGELPEVPRPEPGTPDPVTRLANSTLFTALRPISDAYVEAVAGVPGLGTTESPVPLVAEVASLLGTVTTGR